MTAAGTFTHDSDVDRIFGPVLQAQTYRHLLYELLEFPLGIAYFVMMIVGVSLGFGLAIIAIGFIVLVVTLTAARLFGKFEKELSKALLGAVFEPRPPLNWHWRAILRDRSSWRLVIYLILRLPLGIAGFVASVLMLATIPAIAAPALYMFLPFMIAGERVGNWDEAMLVSLCACILFLLAVHLVNGVAAVSRRLAVALL